MSEQAPNRRWFRPKLQTLFVAMAIAGLCLGWLAYQINWILQRDEYIVAHATTGFGPVELYPGKAPLGIALFGARGWESIGVGKNSPEPWTNADFKTKSNIERLFPEARVYIVTFDEVKAWEDEIKAWEARKGRSSGPLKFQFTRPIPKTRPTASASP